MEVRVLIIEDSEDDALLILRELRTGGFDPKSLRVETAEALIDALREKQWDMVLVDYFMPKFGGMDALRLIRERNPDIPVIFVSGVTGEEFAVTAMKAGANDYILKGSPKRLAPAVERELRDAESRSAHRKAQEEIERFTRHLKAVSRINQMIVRASGKESLLCEACRILVEEGGFPAAWASLLDPKKGTLERVARAEAVGFEPVCHGPAEGMEKGRELRSGLYRASFPLRARGMEAGRLDLFTEERECLEGSAAKLMDELSANIGYALQHLDEVAERKLAVTALRESEERLRTIFESAMDGMFVIDMEGNYLDVNFAGCHMFGYTRDELLSSNVRLLAFPSTDLEERISKAKEKWRKGAFLPEKRLRKKDGTEIWVEMAITPFRVGERELALGVKRDITDRKRSEEALRQSEERFHQIFEQSDNAQFILKYPDCPVIDVNPAAISLYGYSREELAHIGPALFLGGPGQAAEITSQLGSNGVFRIEKTENRKKNGGKVIVSVKGQRIRLRESEVIYCTIQDITEKVRMEEEARVIQAKLIHANKMTSIGTLASGVAHEINNPNNFILFNSTLLTDAWTDTVKILEGYYRENGDFSMGGLPFSEMKDVIPELLSGISEGSRRIKGIVDSLKDFSRVDRSGMDGEVSVNNAIMAAASILSNQIQKYTDNFCVRCAEGLPPVKGSAQKIEQVIINLIINALHALPEKSKGVWVETYYDKARSEVAVKVRDEGAGMTREVLERITEPFFTTKADMGGTGLGLSISYSIMKEHRGNIEFDSRPGAGTTVTLRFPALK